MSEAPKHYDLGDAVTCQATFKKSGVVLDPSTVAFKVKDPAGNVTVYSYPADPQLVKDSTGVYHVDVNANLEGTWFYRFESTGTGQAAEERSFAVRKSHFS